MCLLAATKRQLKLKVGGARTTQVEDPAPKNNKKTWNGQEIHCSLFTPETPKVTLENGSFRNEEGTMCPAVGLLQWRLFRRRQQLLNCSYCNCATHHKIVTRWHLFRCRNSCYLFLPWTCCSGVSSDDINSC